MIRVARSGRLAVSRLVLLGRLARIALIQSMTNYGGKIYIGSRLMLPLIRGPEIEFLRQVRENHHHYKVVRQTY